MLAKWAESPFAGGCRMYNNGLIFYFHWKFTPHIWPLISLWQHDGNKLFQM